MVGEQIVYSLVVTNAGPDAATGVTLSDPISEGVTVTTVTSSQGTCVVEDGILTCSLGTLASGATANVELAVTPPDAGLLANEASVSSNESDWQPSNNSARVLTEVIESTDTGRLELPEAEGLYQNYPNPFHTATQIRFDVSRTAHVALRVFDVLGREVAVLADQEHAPGRYEVSFDASRLPSGPYMYRMEAGGFRAVRTLMIVR